jgi:hypothetical protein
LESIAERIGGSQMIEEHQAVGDEKVFYLQ